MDPFPFGEDDIPRPPPPDVTKPYPYERPDDTDEGPIVRPDVYPARDSLEYHTKEHVQLLTYGPQDTWLVSPVGGSIFDAKPIKRHTPFVIENHECIFQEVQWGGTARISLTRPRGTAQGEQINTSDLMGPMWLRFELPGLVERNVAEDQEPRDIYWTNAMGFAAIESITLLTNDRVFDRITGLAMDAWHELDTGDRYEAICQMVGKYETDYAEELLATAPKTIHTPIPWYHGIPEHPYLPLFAVQYTDIVLEIRFRHLEECIRAIPGETLGEWALVRVNLAVYGDAVELQLLTGGTEIVEVDTFYETEQVVEQINPPIPTPFPVGWDTSGQIAFHPATNVPYTTIIDPVTRNLTVARYENSAWKAVGPSPLSEDPVGEYGHTLAFAPDQTLYVAYDIQRTWITVKQFDETNQTWVNAAGLLKGTVPRDLSFVGDPFRIYLVHNSRSEYPWKTVVSYSSGSDWTKQELDNISFYTHGLALVNGAPNVATQAGVYTWNEGNAAYDKQEFIGSGDYASIRSDSDSNVYAAVGSLFRRASGSQEWTKIDGVSGDLLAIDAVTNRVLVTSQRGTNQPIYLYTHDADPPVVETVLSVDGKINAISFNKEGEPIVSYVSSSKQFFARFRVGVWDSLDTNDERPVFEAKFRAGQTQTWRGRPRIACATYGSYVYVGNTTTSTDQGSVDVYEQGGDGVTWSKKTDQTLTPPNPQNGQLFGTSIAVSSDLLAVGSPGWNGNQGAVDVYQSTENGWVWASRLTDDEASGLGGSVSIRETTLVAAGADGVVRMFVQGTTPSFWSQTQTFQASDYSQIDTSVGPENFGFSVALGGNFLFVGDVERNGTGVVHVIRYSPTSFQWVYETTISPPDFSNVTHFGSSVSIQSSVLAVQSNEAVYLFDRGDTDSDWPLRYKLTRSDARPPEGNPAGYGFAVGADYRSGRLIVSETYGSTETGGVQVFSAGSRTAWFRQVAHTFFPEPLVPNARFGKAVAYAETLAFVSSVNEVVVYHRNTVEDAWQIADRFSAMVLDMSYKGSYLAASATTTNAVVVYTIGSNGTVGLSTTTIAAPEPELPFGVRLDMSDTYLAVVSSNRIHVYQYGTWDLFATITMPRAVRDVAWRGDDLIWVDTSGRVEWWKHAGGDVWGPFEPVVTNLNVLTIDASDSLLILGTQDLVQVYRYEEKLGRYVFRETRAPSRYETTGGLGRSISLDGDRMIAGAETMNWVNYPVWFLAHTSNAFAVITSTGRVFAWGATQMGGDVREQSSLESGVVNVLGTESAFLAQKTDGTVVAWGGYVQQGIPSLGTVVSLVESTDAFAAIEEDGTMHVWGDPAHGGDPGANPITNVSLVVASRYAFAALYTDKTVRAWGDSEYGGDAPGAGLENVTNLVSNPHAFVALKEDKTIVAWGNAAYGGDLNGVDATNIATLVSNRHAFAAIKTDGSVIAWGLKGAGGYVPTLSSDSPVVNLVAASYAFLAIHEDGKVTAWGDPVFGGHAPSLENVVTGVSNRFSFAVLLSDGTVRAWGPDAMGGSAPSMSGVLSIVSSTGAFAAIRADRTVVAWGDPYSGGDASVVQSDLENVNLIQANHRGFTALRRDGSVVSWGKDNYDVSPGAVDLSVATGPIVSTIGAFATTTTDGSTLVWGESRTGGAGDVSSLAQSTHALYANDYAFAAVRTDGTVHAWGDSSSGGDASLVQSDLLNVVAISSTTDAFAALRENGKVVAWGNPVTGGSIPESVQGTTVTFVVGNKYSFAAIRENGSVVAWGLASAGGDVSAVSGLDGGVVQVVSADVAFAALKEDKTVVAWGDPIRGGITGGPVTNVDSIRATESAFAALKADGTIVTWGLPAAGGTVPEGIDPTNVVSVTSNRFAFAALKGDGSVVAWGNAFSGGDASEVQTELNSGGVVEIVATDYAFAARKSDGTVVSWGMEYGGGSSSAVGSLLTSVVELKSTQFAFAARKGDGSVVAWGDPFSGGDTSTVTQALSVGVSSVQGTRRLFAAKTVSDWVVWGDTSTGTDIPSIGVPVDVGVAYEIDLFNPTQLRRTLTLPVIQENRYLRGLLWADGIALHGPERSSAMLNDQEFLWKTRTLSTVELEPGRSSYSILTDDFSLVPNAPVAEIVVYVQSLTRVQAHRWLNTELLAPNRVKLAYMTIEGRDYFDIKSSSFGETFDKQTRIHALQYHSRIPDKLMYVFPISLYPMEYQPSGSINFARIKSAQFHLEFDHPVEETLSVSFLVLYYKVAVLRDGQFQDAYVI